MTWSRLGAAAVALATGLGAACSCSCVGDDGVTLPRGYNTAKGRSIVVDPLAPMASPFDAVDALNGIVGAPAGADTASAAISAAYGGGDGARVTLVAVGPDGGCALGLDAIFAGPSASATAPASYDFDALDAAFDSVAAAGSARVLWRAGFGGDACEPARALLGTPTKLGDVLVGVVRHLAGGASWDPAGRRFAAPRVEVLGDADALLAAGASPTGLVAAYVGAARAVRAAFPAGGELDVPVGGVGFTVTAGASAAAIALPEALLAFLDGVAADGAPLDFVTIRAVTATPYGARAVADAVRAALDARDLGATELLLTALAPADVAPFGDASLDSAYVGAFEVAARAYLQDAEGVGAALSGLAPSAYFAADGAPLPAFMARYGLDQLDGDERLTVTLGGDREGMAVLAARPKGSVTLVRVLVVNANVDAGAASLTYDLRLPAFVAPAVRRVDYRIAVLDHRTRGLGSFVWSEVGSLEPGLATGDVHLAREMPVPGVHLIELERVLAP